MYYTYVSEINSFSSFNYSPPTMVPKNSSNMTPDGPKKKIKENVREKKK